MAEFRDLNKLCICGSAGTYHCRNCKTKFYCSKTCQRRDWPLHKLQCSNDQMISTIIDRQTSDRSINFMDKIRGDGWYKFLDIVYETLRGKLGPNADPHEHCAYWIGIVSSQSADAQITEEKEATSDRQIMVITAVAFVFIAQEPSRLYMFVDKPTPYAGEYELRCADEEMNRRRVLDPECVVYNLDTSRKPMNLAYPLNIARPRVIETIVDWDLRTRS